MSSYCRKMRAVGAARWDADPAKKKAREERQHAKVAARAARKPLPKPEPRPSGAGRYLCAVFACPDADIDVPALLGLRRADVLVLSTPGPFVSHESVARLEHYVSKQRLPLIVVLTHDNCATTATGSGKTPLQKALAERLALARRRAEQRGHSLPRTLARTQCEMLFAASPTLQRAIQDNRLRTLPASVDPKTLAVTWHTKSTEEMPIPVVK